MIINNPEALKNWLIVMLAPLCDADSAALARYVMALLKKDKSIDDLKQIMIEQLDVFLNAETQPFVKMLFEAIVSKVYESSTAAVVSPVADVNATTPTPATKSTDSPAQQQQLPPGVKECTPPVDEDTSSNKQQSAKDTNIVPQLPSATTPSTTTTSSSSSATIAPAPITKSLSPFKATSDKENQPRDRGERGSDLLPAGSRRAPRRTSLRSRSRSRSRSNDRASRRSRSRERARGTDREKTRQFRNKSPPNNTTSDRDRNRRGGFNHRRSGHGDSSERDRSPRRSFKHRSQSPARSRSPSTERPPKKHGQSPKRQRCRDFDDKGYCVRGETCPWDHGVNPVVLESRSPYAMPAHLREYNPDAPDLWTANGNGPPNAAFGGVRGGVFPGARPPSGVYGPRPPGLPGGGAVGFRPGGPHPGGPMFSGFPGMNPANAPLTRELIPIPVVDGSNQPGGGDMMSGGQMQIGGGGGGGGKRRFDLEDNVAIGDVGNMGKRKLPINSRLGPRITNLQNNCSLELRKVPRGLNTIAHLNNHFAKFGKIVNIQVSYEGDPEAAIVTFSTHAEANVAYRSTEAVLNNRFIKVFWHSSSNDGTSSNKDESSITQNVNGRKTSQYHLTNSPAAAAAETPKTTTLESDSNSAATPTTAAATPLTPQSAVGGGAVTAAHVPPSSLRLKNNIKNGIGTPTGPPKTKAAVAQMAHGLTKRKQELLQAYLQQLKSAVEIVERTDNAEQRAQTLSTIKSLQEKIDKLKKEIEADQAQVSATIQSSQQPAKKSKEQAKKELLDVELELIALQQEGGDTTVLQKRYDDLLKTIGGKPNFICNSGIRQGRSTRPMLPVSTSVDRRPKALVITAFDKDDSDGLLGHFKNFGEITKHDVDRAIPQLIISYATRGNAEQAVLRGKVYKDKHLQISWAPSVQTILPALVKPVIESKTLDKTIDLDSSDNLPELRLDDEEEDEESEDRSWRR